MSRRKSLISCFVVRVLFQSRVVRRLKFLTLSFNRGRLTTRLIGIGNTILLKAFNGRCFQKRLRVILVVPRSFVRPGKRRPRSRSFMVFRYGRLGD